MHFISQRNIRARNTLASTVPWLWEAVDRVRFCSGLLSRFERVGFCAPLPYRLKRGILQYASDRLGLSALVETGTYLGDTPWYFRRKFQSIDTIEVSEVLMNEAARRFRRWPNVRVHLGDSTEVLPRIVPGLRCPTLFWLDGHYDKGITGSGVLECPIYAELECIFASAKVRWAVLIDDARNFGRAKDYPSLDQLHAFVKARLPQYSMWVENDIIWIVPMSGLDSLSSRATGLPNLSTAQ
jgi:hypothetical protein